MCKKSQLKTKPVKAVHHAGLVNITEDRRASGVSIAFLKDWQSLEDGEFELEI